VAAMIVGGCVHGRVFWDVFPDEGFAIYAVARCTSLEAAEAVERLRRGAEGGDKHGNEKESSREKGGEESGP